MNKTWNRLQAVWEVLTVKEFLLVKVISRKPIEGSRHISLRSRTDDDKEGDILSLKAGLLQKINE